MLDLKPYEAVNWNRSQQELTKVFWDQQWKQIWFPEEIAVSKDIKQWNEFAYQDTYKKVLGGLTLLDTIQTNIGMNEVARFSLDLQEKALFTVFASFEAIHAKSYSYIFTTLCNNNEIDAVFEWVQRNEYLQYKANRISSVYQSIKENDPQSLWKAMFASVILESFLFYSGFFFPLYLGGQGTLRNSAEVISLILRDESIHGVAVGYYAQQRFKEFTSEQREQLTVWAYEFLLDLYHNEISYTNDLYAETGLGPDVKSYVRYNANKALMNVGFEVMFPDEEVNPIVMNGIRNEGSTYDFFSQKGATYAVAKVAPITDDTFLF
jgi:ribonucleoside-diphosphate reductase beta chain